VARQRMKPVRRRPTATAAAALGTSQAPPTHPHAVGKPRAQWLQTIDSFGGFWTIGIILGAVVLVAAIVIVTGRNGPNASTGVSNAPLMGDFIAAANRNHVTSPSQLVIIPGQPPVGGPHFPDPQAPGFYTSPINDGNGIHSLEHGIIWITYNPSLVSQAGVNGLKDLQNKYSKDVIVSPRGDNSMAVAAGSWEHLLRLSTPDIKQLEKFITTNRNRSPEPGLR
jgi:hypothetical protein